LVGRLDFFQKSAGSLSGFYGDTIRYLTEVEGILKLLLPLVTSNKSYS
jgi:hypothetical protein